MFGPVSSHLKPGDFAPEIAFTEVLSAGAPAPWTSANLTGRLTVLVFFPDTSHNPQGIPLWNALVDQFRDKPVQFVWITAEEDPPLGPWLSQHPVKGWVFLDALGATGQAYGAEIPAAILIGSDRRIIGFDPDILPSARTIDAALEGRITTEPLKPGWAAFQAFSDSGKVLLRADPPRMPRFEDHRPDFPPSYTLHVSPAKVEDGGDFSGDDYQSFQGFELKAVLSRLFDTNPVRIDLPSSLDDGKRYDFIILLPAPENRQSIYQHMAQGIEEHFQVAIAREERLLDVYAVTALNGKPPAAPPREDGGGMQSSSVEFQVAHVAGQPDEFAGPPKAVPLDDIRGISMEGTADEFCRLLEENLDRPVVNETNLEGEFAFHAKAGRGMPNNFLERLRDRLHLSIGPARRRVPVVILKPR